MAVWGYCSEEVGGVGGYFPDGESSGRCLKLITVSNKALEMLKTWTSTFWKRDTVPLLTLYEKMYL